MDLLALFFSLCFPMLGGHDLLDQIPSDVYWKSKGIAYSGEAMLAQLHVKQTEVDAAILIGQLGDADFATRETATQKLIMAGPSVAKEVEAAMKSEDPEVAARAKRIARHLQQGQRDGENRRLMALRGLGELKYATALPQLKAIAAQESGEYAQQIRRTIELIEAAQVPGQKLPNFVTKITDRPQELELEEDLHLMPASAFGVAQIAFAERVKMPLESALKFQPLFGRGKSRMEREPIYYAKMIKLVDEIGNVRIDSLTASITYNEEKREVFILCVIRGSYRWDLIKPLLLKEGLRTEYIDKQEIIRTEESDGVTLIPLSDYRMVAIVGKLPEPLNLKEIIAGEDSPGLMRKNERLWKLTRQVDRTKPIWAAMIAPQEMRQTPWLAALDRATVEVRQKGPELKFSMRARTDDKTKLEPTWQAFDKGLEHAQNEAEQLATIIPAVQPLADIFLSLKYEKLPDGGNLTGETKDIGPLLALPLVLSSGEWTKEPELLP